MDSTSDYIEAMVVAVLKHDGDIAVAEKARGGRRNILYRLAGMRGRPAAMTAYNAAALMNAG